MASFTSEPPCTQVSAAGQQLHPAYLQQPPAGDNNGNALAQQWSLLTTALVQAQQQHQLQQQQSSVPAVTNGLFAGFPAPHLQVCLGPHPPLSADNMLIGCPWSCASSHSQH